MKINKFDEFLNENDWNPIDKYSNVLHGSDVKDESVVKQFIAYNHLDLLVGDIWKYAKENWDIYPEKISTNAMRYGGRFDTVVEIEFKNSELVLWHIQLIYDSKNHNFNNKLISSGKFSFKLFSDMMENGKRTI